MKSTLALCLLMTSLAACTSGSGRGDLALDGGSTGGMSSGSGGTSSGSGGTSSGSGGTSSGAGAIALTVATAETPYQIVSNPPSAGNAFEQLDITLQNKSSATPISTNFALFTLSTDQSLVVNTSSSFSTVVVPECSPTTSVSSGGNFSCTLVFEIPTGQKATTLYYDDKQGHQASASVPPPPPLAPTCQHYFTLVDNQQSPGSPCNQCMANAVGQNGSPGACASQQSAEDAACDVNSCVHACPDFGRMPYPSNTCTCYRNCADAACWSASLAFWKCVVNQCSSSC